MKPALTVFFTSSAERAPLMMAVHERYTAHVRGHVRTSLLPLRHGRTDNLYGCNNEIGDEELPNLCGEACLPREHPLRDAHQHVAHGSRHEHAV